MKTLHFASILAIVALTAFACDDSEDRKPLANVAGTSSHAGSSNANDNGGSGTQAQAGTSNAPGGSANDAGPGSAGSNNDAGAGGAGAPASAEGGAAVGGAPAAGATAGGGPDAGADAGGARGADVGGAGGAGDTVSTALEIIGVWDDNYGGTQTITATDWNGAAILIYDNALNVVYAQNPDTDAFNPNKFTKTVYTQPTNDSFYFCEIVYNANTLADAQATTKVTDASDPENTGCDGFSWTKATKR